MTAANLAIFIGCTGVLAVEELRVPVRVVDARKVWNRVDYLVVPVSGSGQQWVSAERVCDLAAPTSAAIDGDGDGW